MDTSEQRIKIAVQKTGRLTEHSQDLLERCGLKLTKSKDRLFCYGENMPIDLLLVRDDDIPGLVSDDVCDLGIVGDVQASVRTGFWSLQARYCGSERGELRGNKVTRKPKNCNKLRESFK